MATISFKDGSDYALRLSRLATDSDRIAKKAIRAAADIVADKIRANLNANLNDPSSASVSGKYAFKNRGKKTTGGLAESLGITPIKIDRDSNWNCKIGFDGYDKNGVPNQLKARAMESGTSKIKKRPFVRPAVDSTRKAALDEMRRVIDEEIKDVMKG